MIEGLKAAIGPKYYWVVGLAEGRPVIFGPYRDEDTATNMGIEKVEGDFKVIPLPTRNESRATRMLKGKKLENGSTISEALERVSHQSSKETAEL